ncbi:MAG: T9SS type A sorting domain-containing protein, partial [Bacteroidota bacterium]
DNVMRSTYWMDAGRLAELRFFNLDLSQKYSFKFFASRDGGGDRTTIYTINGNSVSLNASYNTNNLVEIQNISPDENGEVVISMTAGPFASYAYLGGLIISSSNRVQETSGARIASQASVVERAEPETFGGQVLMYPNPYRTGILRIAVPSHVDDTFTLKVINMEGKAIHQENMDFQAGSDYVQLEGLESLPEGLYLVQLESEALGQQLLRLIKK